MVCARKPFGVDTESLQGIHKPPSCPQVFPIFSLGGGPSCRIGRRRQQRWQRAQPWTPCSLTPGKDPLETVQGEKLTAEILASGGRIGSSRRG